MYLRLFAVCCLVSIIHGMSIPTSPQMTKDATQTPKEKKESFEKEFIQLLLKYEDILPEIQREFLTDEGGYILEYDSYDDSLDDEFEYDDVNSKDDDLGVADSSSEETDKQDGDVETDIQTTKPSSIRRRRCVSCGCSRLPSGLSEDSAYRWLSFSNNGISETLLAIFNLDKAFKIKSFADDSLADAQSLFPNSVHNGEGDAFRHALWMYRVTKTYGAGVAKDFGDAHERSSVNPLNERLMDLYNNEVGRCLGSNSANHGRDDVDVVREALENGLLQTELGDYPGSSASGYAYGRK
ncbi:uncharacterized protein [Ptychodera flava]|uniref:uncharacterized protein n=1 Tax=Ptychodera flava TaxID=63121 RepID=UPI00396A22D5